MPPRAVLLDLYDTLVDGDWRGWRTELSTLTGIDEDTLGMAYHLTREERNTGAYPTSEDSVRALLGAAGLAAPSDGPRARRRRRRRKPSAARSTCTKIRCRRSPRSGNEAIAPRW